MMTSELYIGALHPSSYDSKEYTVQLDLSTCIRTHLKNGEIDKDTVFEFTDEKGQTRVLKNQRETVHIVDNKGGATGYSFRNLPQFMSFIPTEATVRDAQYERRTMLEQKRRKHVSYIKGQSPKFCADKGRTFSSDEARPC